MMKLTQYRPKCNHLNLRGSGGGEHYKEMNENILWGRRKNIQKDTTEEEQKK